MKKLAILLFVAAAIMSCQKEKATVENAAEFELKDGTLSTDVATFNTYTGIFVSHDMELHGELSIDLASNEKFAATVKLLNGKTLQFKAVTDLTDNNIVHFKGQYGDFTLDITDKNNVFASNFLVDDKEGNIKVYVHERGIPPAILFGGYVDDLDPTFTGAWDMISFGAFEPTLGPPFLLVDEIIVTHTGGTMYFDETFGDLEPFTTSGCIPFPPDVPVEGAFTDGILIQGIDQIATFAGVPSVWTIVGIAPTGVEPGVCAPLPPGVHGFWDRGPRFGTITIITPPWTVL